MKTSYRIGLMTLALVAIMAGIATATQPVDVSIRFNGGGSHNKIYVGRDNTMEIMVRNDIPIWGMSIGFLFTSSSGLFSWITPYGNKPVTTPYIMESADLAASFDFSDGLISTVSALPDSMLIGGVVEHDSTAFPIHSQPIVFCTMKLSIPAGQPAMASGFCVDNIWYPPAGDWKAFVIGILTGFPPTFNGEENSSSRHPDAPPMCFDIVAQSFIRGDLNDDMSLDLSDITFLISYMFVDVAPPIHPESADANSDGRVNIADAMFLIRYIFSGGPEPAC
jgi:hypothetical protein